MIRLAAELAGQADDRIVPADHRWFDVEQTTDLLSAAAWQPRIKRRGHAERFEVRRRQGGVFRDLEVHEPPGEVTHEPRYPRSHRMLDPRWELPVVARALPPTGHV